VVYIKLSSGKEKQVKVCLAEYYEKKKHKFLATFATSFEMPVRPVVAELSDDSEEIDWSDESDNDAPSTPEPAAAKGKAKKLPEPEDEKEI
jgi:hypothetical protein